MRISRIRINKESIFIKNIFWLVSEDYGPIAVDCTTSTTLKAAGASPMTRPKIVFGPM